MPKLLIIVVLVIGAAIFMYQSPGISPLTLNSTRGVVKLENPPTDPPKPDKPPDKGTPHRKSDSTGTPPKKMPEQAAARTGPSPAEAPSQAEVVAPVKSAAPTPAVTPDVPFPTPESLKKGSTSAEIRGRFGAPAFDIVGSREGHVLEKFYYVNRDKSQLTVVYMDNGLLTSVESVSSPYFQLPGVRDPGREPLVRRP